MSDIPIQKCPAVEYQESFVLFRFFYSCLLDRNMIPISGEDQDPKEKCLKIRGMRLPVGPGQILDRICGGELPRIS